MPANSSRACAVVWPPGGLIGATQPTVDPVGPNMSDTQWSELRSGTILSVGDRFRVLQTRLATQFEVFRADPTQPYTSVVVPSQSLNRAELEKIEGIEHYEERALCHLMLLRYPQLRIVFVTSKRLEPLVVDYYLHQLRGVPPAHARRRLTLLDCDDASARPLTEKILQRPRLIARIRAAVSDPTRAHLNVFNSTPTERELALALGIPAYAADPELVHLGNKTGSRRAFRQAGIPMAPGREDLRDRADLVEGVTELWAERPNISRVVVKLNDGFSGEGNAILDLRPLHARLGIHETAVERQGAVRAGMENLMLEAPDVGVEAYLAQFDGMGGVCEEWLEGAGKRSPSAQLRINPLMEVIPISTHDQVLGGPNKQVFMGATFPADASYRIRIQELGRQVATAFSEYGVIGRLAVDFVAIPKPDAEPDVFAVEVNLRQGGTTHPFNTLKLMTDGQYDERSGEFLTAQGQPRCYFTTDALQSDRYRGLLPYDLLHELVVRNMHFRADETGVLFHLLGCLSQFGKLGCVCVAPTVEEACGTYRDVVAMLDDLVSGG